MTDMLTPLGPVALIQAEEPIPMAAYAVVTLLGAGVGWALFRRDLVEQLRGALAPAFVAGSTSIALPLAMVMSLCEIDAAKAALSLENSAVPLQERGRYRRYRPSRRSNR